MRLTLSFGNYLDTSCQFNNLILSTVGLKAVLNVEEPYILGGLAAYTYLCKELM